MKGWSGRRVRIRIYGLHAFQFISFIIINWLKFKNIDEIKIISFILWKLIPACCCCFHYASLWMRCYIIMGMEKEWSECTCDNSRIIDTRQHPGNARKSSHLIAGDCWLPEHTHRHPPDCSRRSSKVANRLEKSYNWQFRKKKIKLNCKHESVNLSAAEGECEVRLSTYMKETQL